MPGPLYLKRDITSKLEAWKTSPFRKPLILKGARQVGKTKVLKEFGRSQFQNTAYVSLERSAKTGRASMRSSSRRRWTRAAL